MILKIKPCVYCGGKARMKANPPWWFIECKKCGRMYGAMDEEERGDCRNTLVSEWNTPLPEGMRIIPKGELK